jgi:hypothetical protein
MSESLKLAHHARMLCEDGFVVLDALLPPPEVDDARSCVLANTGLMRNTRPNISSRHIAGFHRYPELEHLHLLLSTNAPILETLRKATNSLAIRSIGLSDITVNRSQEWHVDLLRGKYRHHLSSDICWGREGGGVYKALLYLQDGQSLRVASGGHTRPVLLDNDRRCRPATPSEVKRISVSRGSVILMDIRLPHRGASEKELSDPEFLSIPKILISTVLGDDQKPLTAAMERGNLERLLDWDVLHRKGRAPRMALGGEAAELATA